MAITHDKLRIGCKLGISKILQIHINHQINHHAEAMFEGISTVKYKELLNQSYAGEIITLYQVEDSEELTPLFYGIIQEVLLYKGLDYTRIVIRSKSLSYKMDIFERSRSFQNTCKSFTEIMQSVISEHEAQAIYHIDDAQIKYPFIQFRETDWAFLKRLASHSHVPLIPALFIDKASVYIGLHKGKYINDLEFIEKELISGEAIYTQTNSIAPTPRYSQYSFWSEMLYEIGDYFSSGTKTLYVCKREILLKDSRLLCFYTLCEATGFYTETIYNENLRGISLTGKVIETKNEDIKLHLDIDEKQETTEAYFYPWYPETGNIMYCMPQIATYASLHFPQADEKGAAVINSVRMNGHAHPELQNPANRIFTTEHQKRMQLFPDNLSFLDMNSGSQLMLEDSSACVMKSVKNVNIQANGNVTLSGASVSVTSPKEISVAKKSLAQSTVLNLCNNVDTIGGIATFRKTKKSSGISFPVVQQEKYDMSDLTEEILSSVPVHVKPKSLIRMVMESELLK